MAREEEGDPEWDYPVIWQHSGGAYTFVKGDCPLNATVGHYVMANVLSGNEAFASKDEKKGRALHVGHVPLEEIRASEVRDAHVVCWNDETGGEFRHDDNSGGKTNSAAAPVVAGSIKHG